MERQLNLLQKRLNHNGIELQFSDSAKDFIATNGFKPEFGARPVRRAITEHIEDPLSDLILLGKANTKAPIRVLKKGEKLVFVK